MTLLKFSWLLLVPMFSGCQERESTVEDSRAPALRASVAIPKPSVGVVDAPIESFQRDLLQLAFAAASKFPSIPHAKNRGRAQDLVIAACFEMDQPLLAVSLAPSVEGWRRAVAYADFAWCCAKVDDVDGAKRYIGLAEAVLDESRGQANAQDWRADKVRIKIARALRALGDESQSKAVLASVSPSSAGAVDRSWTGTMASHLDVMTSATAANELERITETFLSQSLGEQYTSLMLVAGIHGRFFAEEAVRAITEERLFVRFEKLPTDLRLDAMAPLVGHYVEHQDLAGARNVIHTMTQLMAKFSWRPEQRLPQLARIANLRDAVGDRDRAKSELQEAFQYYNDNREQIVNIDRCEALRALALAWHKFGDAQQADDLLAICLEEALVNPNSRPRCDDLVETCIAMAHRKQQASAALWQRLHEISNGLSTPW
jgi:hypothetical protein